MSLQKSQYWPSALTYLRAKRWFWFLLGGGLNTLISYLIYLVLKLVLNYQIAYLFAYVAGIAFAYWFSSRFVFKLPLSWRGLFAYPLVYVVQYVMSAFVLFQLVEYVQISANIAPLLISALMVPVTYLMSKTVLYKIALFNSVKQTRNNID